MSLLDNGDGVRTRILPTRNGNLLKVGLYSADSFHTDPTYKEWKRHIVNMPYMPSKTRILPTRNGNSSLLNVALSPLGGHGSYLQGMGTKLILLVPISL